MFLKKDIIDILRKENRKLKKENFRLKTKLESIEKYKNDYEQLIKQVNEQIDRYVKLNDSIERLEKEYKDELKRV